MRASSLSLRSRDSLRPNPAAEGGARRTAPPPPTGKTPCAVGRTPSATRRLLRPLAAAWSRPVVQEFQPLAACPAAVKPPKGRLQGPGWVVDNHTNFFECQGVLGGGRGRLSDPSWPLDVLPFLLMSGRAGAPPQALRKISVISLTSVDPAGYPLKGEACESMADEPEKSEERRKTELEKRVRQTGLKKKHIANLLGVHVVTFSNWLKYGNIPDDKLAILVGICLSNGVRMTPAEIRAANGFLRPRGRPSKKAVALGHYASLTHLPRKELANIPIQTNAAMRVLSQSSQTSLLPVLGRIPAGGVRRIEELAEASIEYPTAQLKRGGEHFALKVHGDSMDRLFIEDGDLAIIRKQETAKDGQVVVAALDGEVTLKVLRLRKDTATLLPESNNPAHQPIECGDRPPEIYGVLVGLLKEELPKIKTEKFARVPMVQRGARSKKVSK